jgi:acyl-CoA thioester hydrolase
MEFERPVELAEYRLVIRWPVQWGDQDAFGHVNNAIYFRWFESARIAYLDQLGLSALMQQERVGPILAAINCNFRRQIKYPDQVQIGARVSRLGRSSMTMEHRLHSEQLGQVAADGESTIVVFDYQRQKPVGIPADIRAAIEQAEGRSFV